MRGRAGGERRGGKSRAAPGRALPRAPHDRRHRRGGRDTRRSRLRRRRVRHLHVAARWCSRQKRGVEERGSSRVVRLRRGRRLGARRLAVQRRGAERGGGGRGVAAAARGVRQAELRHRVLLPRAARGQHVAARHPAVVQVPPQRRVLAHERQRSGAGHTQVFHGGERHKARVAPQRVEGQAAPRDVRSAPEQAALARVLRNNSRDRR